MGLSRLVKLSVALAGVLVIGENAWEARAANSTVVAEPLLQVRASPAGRKNSSEARGANSTAVAEPLLQANATGGGGYREQEAVEFAYLSTAAFCESALASWDCGVPCEGAPGMHSVQQVRNDAFGAHAYMGRLRGQCILVFRGTANVNGWAADLASLLLARLPGCSYRGEACRVGLGFLKVYMSIREGIRESLSAIGCTTAEPLAITGHSLGGALTTLALFDLHRLGYTLAKTYTFGSPRMGDATFTRAFKQALGAVPVYRVTRADDPFVNLPAKDPFFHVGTEVFYVGRTSRGYRLCQSSGEDPACSAEHLPGREALSRVKCLSAQLCGHQLYLHPKKKGLMNGGLSCRAPHILFP